MILHIEQYIWHDSLDYKPKSKCDTGDELTRKYISLQESTQVFIVTRDSGNDGEEGVTTEINKQTRCDLRD